MITRKKKWPLGLIVENLDQREHKILCKLLALKDFLLDKFSWILKGTSYI